MRKALIATAVGVSFIAGAASANAPEKHPYYLHALSDLRAARSLLEHRQGDAAVKEHEHKAIEQIDFAINDIRQAAIDDHKPLSEHPPIDVPGDHPGKLHEAEALLDKVHADVSHEEDDPKARDLKRRSLAHIDFALDQTKSAISAVEHEHRK